MTDCYRPTGDGCDVSRSGKAINFLSGVVDGALPAAEQLAINACGTVGQAGTLANKIKAVNRSHRDALRDLGPCSMIC